MDVGTVASGFVHLLVSQVSSRLVTFGLNLVIARYLPPDAYGLSSIQFHLIVTTIMMLSREGFRRGCMRLRPEGGSKHVSLRRVWSVSWPVLPLGWLVSAIVSGVVLVSHQRSVKAAGEDIPSFHSAVILLGAACDIELLSEPLYIESLVNMKYSLRTIMDSGPLAAKSLLTLALLVTHPGLPPAMVFAWAQLAFAVATLAGYSLAYQLLGKRQHGGESQSGAGAPAVTGGEVGSQGGSTGPGVDTQPEDSGGVQRGGGSVVTKRHKADTAKTVGAQVTGLGDQEPDGPTPVEHAGCGDSSQQTSGGGDREVWSATAVFSVQSAEKLLLSEGSKLVMAGLATSYDQGVVGLVGNLGSLVVRTVFQPLEEVAFVAFSRQRASSSTPEALQQSLSILSALVNAVTVLGLLAVSFGPPNAQLAIQLVYGSRWAATEAPAVLAMYCGYILLLAVNGVTESFVHAVLDSRGLVWSNVGLVGLTVAHAGCCWVAIQRLGSVGLVLADSANMVLRIAVSLWCIHRHFRSLTGFRLSQLSPRPMTWMLMGVASVTLRVGQSLLQPTRPVGVEAKAAVTMRTAAMQVALSAVVLAVCLVGVVKAERQTLAAVRSMWRGKHSRPSEQAGTQTVDTSHEQKKTN